MDDSCAVCAEPLEWVGYGSCCHREVCSTCVVRMRFILDDRRCCICKTESSVVFVTKALGDFTRVVTDFSVFPQGPVEGKSGHFWYHEDTQAFFDDAEHYKMIKAMCKLSCSVCDRNAEEQGSEGQKRRSKFRSIEQLKGHLFHQHKLFMCNLCLEGRKVFICEQKLYTRSQLNQHIKTGDSEVDGSESERGGFMGHPMCEFCRNPFYGENELYMHMSQEHYTCHICQRQHPGDYDYFRNYDDLEIHFRQEHFLCESEVCLAKKFVVFQTEAEMKRHNAIEHGGNMSRSKRNAALQIPTSFRYRRVEQEQRRGRGRGFRPEPSSNQLSLAIQASLETAMADGRVRDTSLSHAVTGHGETNQVDRILLDPLNANSGAQGISRYPGTENQNSQTSQVLEESSFPPLVDRDLPELSSRYAQALSQSTWSSSKLEDESFPPLPGASNKPKIVKGVETSTANNTLAARLHQRKKGPVTIISAAPRPHDIGSSTSQVRSNPSQGFPSATSANHWPAINPTRGNGFASPLPANSSWNLNYNNRMKHSSSAPNLAEEQHPNQATSSVVHEAGTSNHVDINSQPHPNVEDVHTANKFLIERIRTGLGMDEDKYVAFKTVSAEYRQGLINTSEYLSYIEQFGLSHLVLELAWLCPDAQKRKELIDVYNVNLRNRSVQENGDRNVGSSRERKLKKGKGKGKEHTENSSADGALTDSFLDTIRKLQLNNKPQSGEVEVLTKDGYRPTKDKNQPSVVVGLPNSSSTNVNSDRSANRELQPAGSVSSDQTSTATNSKQHKKTSKFHRARLGDGSVAALLDLHRADSSPERPEREGVDRPSEGIPVRGVWRKGGVQKLFQ